MFGYCKGVCPGAGTCLGAEGAAGRGGAGGEGDGYDGSDEGHVVPH